MLNIKGLHSGYGKAEILHGVSLELRRGEIVALLGLNGAGKSTLLRTISGLLQATAGEIQFNGEDLVGLKPEQIVWAGLAQVPEGRQLFGPLSVAQNLNLGTYARGRRELPLSNNEMQECVLDLFPILRERKAQLAGSMSGGEQQMLSIARALMAQPQILMLDEPSVGLSPVAKTKIFEAITSLRNSGMAVLLVEQDVPLAIRVADRHYVLESGNLVEGGAIDDLLGMTSVKS